MMSRKMMWMMTIGVVIMAQTMTSTIVDHDADNDDYCTVYYCSVGGGDDDDGDGDSEVEDEDDDDDDDDDDDEEDEDEDDGDDDGDDDDGYEDGDVYEGYEGGIYSIAPLNENQKIAGEETELNHEKNMDGHSGGFQEPFEMVIWIALGLKP